MTVSFVHAGMLTLVQALPILMGASVGNTFIAWIMAAEFNFSISNYIYPLILVAFIMTYYRKWNALGNSIFGLCFILLSLGLLRHMADDMTLTGPDGIARYLAVSHENYGSYAILLFIGAAVTFGVQSSAVLMALQWLCVPSAYGPSIPAWLLCWVRISAAPSSLAVRHLLPERLPAVRLSDNRFSI